MKDNKEMKLRKEGKLKTLLGSLSINSPVELLLTGTVQIQTK